ncbi:hypothetical protein FQZ97_1090410 [compost metagenome]
MVVEWEKDPDPYAYGKWPERLYSDAWTKRMEKHQTRYTRHRAVVEVAPYQDLGVVSVHFLPCDGVKVAASDWLYGHPSYPYNEPLNLEEPTTCPAR